MKKYCHDKINIRTSLNFVKVIVIMHLPKVYKNY